MRAEYGYTEDFIQRALANRAFKAREHLRKEGLSRFRNWGMPKWARQIVLEVSNRTGVCVSEMASDTRIRQIVKARNEAIYLIKSRKPVLSMPRMGQWFNRDHTSILHSLASYCEMTGEPAFGSYNLNRVRKRNRAMRALKRKREISQASLVGEG